MSGLVALEMGRVAHLELVSPPLTLVNRELLGELDEALLGVRDRHPLRLAV